MASSINPSTIMWGSRYPDFLKVGEVTGRILYCDTIYSNLSLRTDFRLGQDSWLSVGYLNIMLHTSTSVLSISSAEWFLLESELPGISRLAKHGRPLASLRNWKEHCVTMGHLVFAPSKTAKHVWVGKHGNQILMSKRELSNLKLHYARTRLLVTMSSKYCLVIII